MPFVGFLCGLLGIYVHDYLNIGGHPIEAIPWGIFPWIGFCVLGLVAAAIALVRSERLWGITLFGFLLNPLSWFFLWGLFRFFVRWF
jgi:hypothetical protein